MTTHSTLCVLLVTLVAFGPAMHADNVRPGPREERMTPIEQSGALEGLDPQTVKVFREAVSHYAAASRQRHQAFEALTEDPINREIIRRALVGLLTRDVEPEPGARTSVEEMGLLLSLPRETLAEAISEVLPEVGRVEGFVDQYSDTLAHTYRAGAPGAGMDTEMVRQLVQEKEGRDRDLLLQLLLIHDPVASIRPLLTVHHDELQNVAEVSTLSRNLDEMLWRSANRIEVDEDLEEAVRGGLVEAAKSDAWWVRLYVIEIMHRYEGLKDHVVCERLADDPVPVVGRRARALLPDAGN